MGKCPCGSLEMFHLPGRDPCGPQQELEPRRMNPNSLHVLQANEASTVCGEELSTGLGLSVQPLGIGRDFSQVILIDLSQLRVRVSLQFLCVAGEGLSAPGCWHFLSNFLPSPPPRAQARLSPSCSTLLLFLGQQEPTIPAAGDKEGVVGLGREFGAAFLLLCFSLLRWN